MHDSEEVIVPFTFRNGDGGPVVVPDAQLVYEVWQQPPGGAAPVKMVTTGTQAVFDLSPATSAEIAAAFQPPLPPNAVWVEGKNALSPTGNFFVKAVVSPPGVTQFTVTGASFAVSRDPAIAVSGTGGTLGPSRPRQH